ncbi:LysM peptidoglycan-binding domain-containing protein [Methylobacterium oryzisoli]|uniref:LysM peptidoglycan-binding domain-containing protein n=1 Tax=Methylobacterium oryzisoli TaxID=3385502 RepID=UPI00397CA016
MTAELRRGIYLAVVGSVSGFVLIGVVASGTRLLSIGGPSPAPTAGAPASEERLAALPAPAPKAESKTDKAEAPRGPSFDVIRIEPEGDSVIAGQALPGAEVEILRNGEVFARTTADPAGNFALTPPPLPAGSSEITLRSVAPDGTRLAGAESAVVALAPDRRGKPLVAMTAPGRPTEVLSRPDAETSRPAAAAPAAASPPPPAEIPHGTTPIKVVSVDAEAGGKLFVSAQGAPGAAVRLYLNDTLIAPGQAGPDGRIAFAIGRGVRPGDYRVRIDQVDPASGSVKTRSEVKFAVPATLDLAAAELIKPGRAPAGAPRTPAPTLAAKPAEPARDAGRPDAGASAALPGTAPSAKPVEPVKAEPAKPDLTKPGAVAQLPRTGETARLTERPGASAPAPAGPHTPVADAALAPMPAETGRALEPGTVFVPGVSTATVARGDNLWTISRKAYGRGTRYTVIFGANQEQIRNPHRIYPGQVFVLPGEAPAASASRGG